MTASSAYDKAHGPEQARLHAKPTLGFRKSVTAAGAWKPKNADEDKAPWLQIDLGASREIKAVATQGSPIDAEWVEQFDLLCGDDPSRLTSAAATSFQANTDENTVVMNVLPQPVRARFVRFVIRWQSRPAGLRVELFG